MAAERAYIDGNTVRKIQVTAAPQRQEEQREAFNPKTRRKIERVRAFDLRYTLMLVVAIGFTFAACASMIGTFARISAQRREIAALETQYQNLANDNDAIAAQVNSDIDLNAIKEIAIGDLGMVYPNAGQVVTYDSANEQYVKQYKDVPKMD